MTNDIEAAARAYANSVGHGDACNRTLYGEEYRCDCGLDALLAALAHATRGEGDADAPKPRVVVAGPAVRAMDAILDKMRGNPSSPTPPPATGEGFAGLPVAYQSSSIGAPPWDGPATGEADPDPRGEDREAVEAARGEGHGPGKCLPVDAVEADRVVASREQDERERWIRADERERCAKVCDERVEIHAMYRRYDTKDGEAEREAAECAAAIRALRTAERGEGGR